MNDEVKMIVLTDDLREFILAAKNRALNIPKLPPMSIGEALNEEAREKRLTELAKKIKI